MNTLATAAPEAPDFDQRPVVAARYHLLQAGKLQTSLPLVSITMTGRSSKPEPDDDDAGARWDRRSRMVMADPAHALHGADFIQPETSKHLKRLVAERQQHNNTVEQLGHVAPIQQSEQAWRRVIVEKPFGHDLASAGPLNRPILRVLSENRPYRIDHFLGKETVQNILVLRLPPASSSRSGIAIMSTLCRSRRLLLRASRRPCRDRDRAADLIRRRRGARQKDGAVPGCPFHLARERTRWSVWWRYSARTKGCGLPARA